MNPISSFNTNLIRTSLLSIVLTHTAIAGGPIDGRSLMDDYLQNKASASTDPATPSTAINISNISLNSANYYNEFQSDVNTNDNTANGNKKSLSTIISNKLSALNLSNYNAKMIRNHAEVMSCGGCHQNSNEVEIAQNVNWPKSGTFVHVDKQGVLSSALTEQFLPAQSALLKVYWQTIVEKWHFSEMDYSSARNYFGGFNNVPSYPNASAFATLQADGSIKAWGNSESGGTNAPTDKGYTKIYSTIDAFAALKADGSIKAWGNSDSGGSGAPAGSGYTKIYSTDRAFAALKADGSITAWGAPGFGGSDAPAGTGYTKIYSTAVPLPPLKPMVQSRRGVTQILEAQAHPLAVAIPRFIQLRCLCRP